MRQEVEQEVREEYETRDLGERSEERARARLALAIVTAVCILLGLPLAGLVTGLAVRAFRWASGL